MDGIFSLPYSEYEAIGHIQKYLTRKKGYSIFVPTSRQEKGVDFLVHNVRNRKSISVQVKSSRSYLHTGEASNRKKEQYLYNFWFNNFIKTYRRGLADIYILFGLYPTYSQSKNIKSRTQFWKPLILVFADKEMETILKQIRTKKTRKPDRFFYIAFTTLAKIVCTRGFSNPSNLAPFALHHRWRLIKRLLA